MLTTKLDDFTRREWKQKIGRREQVPLTELMEFMEIRALEYQQTQGEKLRSGLMLPENRKKKVFQLTKGKCPYCDEDHPLYNCPKLLNVKDRKQRTEIIKNLRLCFKCLGAHAREDCKKEKMVPNAKNHIKGYFFINYRGRREKILNKNQLLNLQSTTHD